MTPILSPITFNEGSDNVANLQAALLLILPAIGFTDFKIPASEIQAKRAFDGTGKGINILRDKFPNQYNRELLVDELMAKLINSFLGKLVTVNGKLTDSTGQVLSGHTILISEFDIDQIVELGGAATNQDGTFTFSFLYEAQLQDGDGRTNPDLLFKVRGSFGQILSALSLTRNADAVFVIENGVEIAVPRLAPSEKAPIVLMNCPPEIEVRIVVITAQSNLTEFEQLLIQLQPFMRQLGFVDLKEDDQNFQISFLSKETGIDKAKIESLKNAFTEEHTSSLPAWAFFGLDNIPIAIAEWNNKTFDEFTAILQPLKPTTATEDVNALAEKLMAYAKEKSVRTDVSDFKTAVGDLLKSSLESDTNLDSFLDGYARHDGTPEEFWKLMEQNPQFSQKVPKIQLSLQLSQLTLGNTGLIQSLQDKGISDTRQLVNLNNEDWLALTSLHPEGIPTHIVADTVQERATIYANELQTLVEIAFPTEVIKKSATSAEFVKFLDLNPDFDFTKTPVESYLQSKGETALQGIENKNAVANEIRQTQRLYAITASANDARTLASMGFESAFQLAKMPFSEFTKSVNGKLTAEAAALYHTKATAINEAAAITYMQLREYSMPNQALALGNFDNQLKTIPNWQNLFGQVETCECQHCRSVYSPAAYFVDLLHILLGQKNGKARKELFRRRPDLKYTKLSCEHTDTLIPYIDLVNEVLETYVAQSHIGDNDADTHAQTSTNDTSEFTESELAANPQHPNANAQTDADKAYQLVSEATYPLSLPFDLPLETARQFLLAQNSSRYELMQTFGDAQSDATIAESLGLSELEFRILAGKKQILIAGQPVEEEWDIAQDLFGYEPADIPVVANGLGETLKPVREFLSRTAIAYTDLIDLVDSQFLNPDQTIVLVLDVQQQPTPKETQLWEVAHACDLDFIRLIHTDLSALTAAELAGFNRFIRLWKKLGCTIRELDLILSAVGTEFTSAVLHEVASLWQLKQSLNLSAEQSATLLSTIPTKANKSLYERLFLNKAILQIDDKFELSPVRTELVNASESIHDHQAAILAAFQITEQELAEIAQSVNMGLDDPNTLTLANLTLIYRFKLIAKTNRLTIHELILLLPFAPHPLIDGLIALTENQLFFSTLKRNGLTASAIAYLFTSLVEPGSTLPPKAEGIQKSATYLREGLVKITQATTPFNGIVTADFLKSQLGTLLNEQDVKLLIGILDGSNVHADPDVQLPAINKVPGATTLSDVDFLQNPPVLKEYKDVLANYLPIADADSISDAQTAAERFSLFWNALSVNLIPHLKDTFAQQHLIAQFKTDADLVAFVYPDLRKTVLGVEVGSAVTFEEFSGVYIQLVKLLWLVNKLKLSAKELTYFQKNGVAFDNFNWSDFDVTRLKSWLRVVDFVTLRNALPDSNGSLISVFETAQAVGGAISKSIVEVTGYDLNTVNLFVSSRPASDFINEKPLLILQSQLAISQTIGVSITKLAQWSGSTINFAQAQDIKRTLKANYDETAWVDISLGVHNQLRNKQRDALAAYLLQKPEIKMVNLNTINDLYAYFLIDLEMDAVMKTSRLKQAISSVQLFVQRCVLNLETAVSPVDIDPKQWSWMKLYRVWEANRKVFLYPENWIEPELRDNKSPFFIELESELLQSEVTNESAEKALLNYLMKLDEVGRLDICGTYKDSEAQELHVFGRSFNPPHQYFYRKLNLRNHEWTPWEKMQLDIQGNNDGDSAGVHLIPVVWNRRLYVFWPLFTERIDKEKQQQDKDAYQQWKRDIENWKLIVQDIRVKNREIDTRNRNGESLFHLVEPAPPIEPTMEVFPRAYWEVKLAWSEYQQSRWSTKKASSSFIRTPTDTYAVAQTFVYRFLVKLGPTLRIQLLYHPFMLLDMGEFVFNCNGKMSVNGAQDDPAKIDVISPKQANYYQGLLSVKNSGRNLDWYVDESIPMTLTDSGTRQKEILRQSSREYKVIYSSDHTFRLNTTSSFFYQDQQRNYYVEPRQEWYIQAVPSLVDRYAVAIPSGIVDKNLVTRSLVKAALPPAPDPNRLQSISIKQIDSLFKEENISVQTAVQLRSEKSIAKLVASPAQEYTSVNERIGKSYLDVVPLSRSVAKLDFKPFFHAYACGFIKTLNLSGINGLLTLTNQLQNDSFIRVVNNFTLKISTNFEETYRPNSTNVSKPYPVENVDFSLTGAYSLYNWELFFHIPMLLANRLSKNQQFEEALRWYHFVFDPTTHDPEQSARRYWQVVPLRNTPAESLQVLLQQLNLPATDPKRQELEKAIEAWRNEPFKPHLIARMRLLAYQKNVLMKYLDNLIAWADNLFRQDTIEAINQAIQLYIIASELVVKRTEIVPSRGTVVAKTYQELEQAGLNAFSNALVQMETTFPFFNLQTVQTGAGGVSTVLSTTVPADYFSIPDNPNLLAYRDTIADRLFKIRHSLNIDGVERQLALFEPPIDPALLVQAVAKGIDISSVLADLNAPLPYYRFGYIVQKALEICAELKSLGNTLLSVLEKKDNEALSLIRTEQENSLLGMVKVVKQLQIKEAQRNREGLEKTREVTQHKYDYYKVLASTNLIEPEKEHLRKLELAKARQEDAAGVELSANIAHVVPNFNFPAFGGSFGGSNVGSALNAWAKSINNIAAGYTYEANRSSSNASNERRLNEWVFQRETAGKELTQIDKQIVASSIRESMAEQELTNQEQQLDNARQVLDFMRNKYTQEELYGWMQGEISTIYFQCYQLAYNLAKKAEKTYRFELGLAESNFIQFGIWDSFRKGLMSGERLYLSLKQMEKAYMDQNRREYELTRHISLVQHFPLQLLQLKANGSCIIELPEALFDADYPGQFMRRIKNMSISMPCVVGPYTSINCTLSLLSSSTRLKNTLKGGKYERDQENEDDRFADQFGAIQSVATSHAQNDSGMFELNFRDERYLPFEYAGASSRWKIELPHETNAFDFETLSDVILHLKYTAREGGKVLKEKALNYLTSAPQSPVLLSVKHHFANEWYQYSQKNKGKEANQLPALELVVTPEQLPYFARTATIVKKTIDDASSQAFSYKKKGTIDFKNARPIVVDGQTITFAPNEKVDELLDVFLILQIQ